MKKTRPLFDEAELARFAEARGAADVVAAVQRASIGLTGPLSGNRHVCIGEDVGKDPNCSECVQEYLQRRKRA